MMRLHSFILLGAFTAFLATTPQTTRAQDDAFIGGSILSAPLRSATTIQGRQLGEFLAKVLTATVPADRKSLEVALRIQFVSRRDGIVDRNESKPIELKPGVRYPGSVLNPNLGLWVPKAFEAQTFTVSPSPQVSRYPPQGMPQECPDATHAVVASLYSKIGTDFPAGFLKICLRTEG